MSTAPVAIVFHHFDPDTEPALLGLLRERSFRRRFSEPVTELWLREPYGKHTDSLVPELLTAIRDLDPTATFQIAQSPTGDLRSDRVVVDPELGEFHSDVDDDNTPLLRVEDLIDTVAAAQRQVTHGAPPARVLTEFDRAVGGPWQRRLAQLHREHPTNRPHRPTPQT